MVCGCFLIPASLLYSLTAFLFLLSSSSAQSTTSPSTSSTTVAGNFASIVPTQAGYSYYGCYNETTGFNQAGNVRALAGNMTSSDSMTVASCMAFCASSAFAGLEYGRECWCGGTLNADSSKLDDKTCSLRCSGDQNEICGGHLALSTYQKSASSTGDATTSVMSKSLVVVILGAGMAGVLFGT